LLVMPNAISLAACAGIPAGPTTNPALAINAKQVIGILHFMVMIVPLSTSRD
jgi:hypothetical protein